MERLINLRFRIQEQELGIQKRVFLWKEGKKKNLVKGLFKLIKLSLN